jgi:hypothetical protein
MMPDFVFIVVTALFFLFSILYVNFCDGLR